MMHDGGWAWGWWILGGSMMLAFWAVVFWALVSLTRRPPASAPVTGRPHPGAWSGAESVLADRYARGEIDDEEFLRRRDALRRT